MKKSKVFGISLLLIIVLSNLALALRINEVESNPEGSDAKNEWVELYSESEIDLEGWKLVNSDEQSKELEGVFQGYMLINFSTQWLDNSEESLSLYEGDILRDSVDSLQDSYNDNRTWQYCYGDWSFLDSSKSKKNDCEEEENNTNEEEQENNNTETAKKEKISVELENIEEDIQNGEELEVDVLAFNLEDKEYDIRLYVYDEDGNMISEMYDDKEDKWKSGSYFITEFFQGPGNQTETAKLRIREDSADFKGEASIRARIRASGTSPIIAERAYSVDVLEKEDAAEEQTEEESTAEEQPEESEEENDIIEQELSDSTGNVIKLGKRETGNVIKLGKRETAKESIEESAEGAKEAGKILYESSNEKIKKYSMYGLNLLLVVIIIFLLISFKKKQNQE